MFYFFFFFFSSRRRHTRLQGDWSSDVCSSDLEGGLLVRAELGRNVHRISGYLRRQTGSPVDEEDSQAKDDRRGAISSNCSRQLAEGAGPALGPFVFWAGKLSSRGLRRLNRSCVRH